MAEEVLEEGVIEAARLIASKFCLSFTPRLVRELSDWEVLRLKEVTILPCRRCMNKRKCKHECEIFKNYVDKEGVFSTRDTARNYAVSKLRKQDLKIYRYIQGLPI